jgi:Zn-dependent protease with chaperone function
VSDRDIAGWLYQAGASARAAASVTHDGDIFLLATSAGEERLDRAQLRIPDRIAGVPLRIELADGQAFESHGGIDADLLHGLWPAAESRRWVHRLEHARPRVFVAIIGVLLAVFAASAAALPWAADIATELVPPSVERQLGLAALGSLDKTVFRPSRLPINFRADTVLVLHRLVDATSLEPIDLYFRDGRFLGANALTLPGRLIVVTDDLVRTLSQDQIAGVIAHELGHVSERHVLRQVFRSSFVATLISTVAGDVSGLVGNAAGVAALLTRLSFSRRFEVDADDYAIRLMVLGGYKPSGLADALDAITRDCGSRCERAAFLSSHPAPQERIARIRTWSDRR